MTAAGPPGAHPDAFRAIDRSADPAAVVASLETRGRDAARRNSLSCEVSSGENVRVRLPEKKSPVSAPRRRISWSASRDASVAASEASMACSNFFMSGSMERSRRIEASIS